MTTAVTAHTKMAAAPSTSTCGLFARHTNHLRDHHGVVLRLDSRYRLLWRSPTSLQFGVDSPPVVLSELSTADDLIIAALVRGVSRSGLSMIGESAGAREAEVERLLEAVSPILRPEVGDTPAPAPQRIVLCGSGQCADALGSVLAASGIIVLDNEPASDATAQPDLAIIVAQFVIEPELHGAWLRRDVPHLAVVFGDARVRIGPVIEPGRTPCLYCLERWATDADPARPALASQLWGKRSPAETSLVTSEVVAIVSRYAVSRLATRPQTGALGAPATSLELDIATGQVTERVWLPHPECACLALPQNLSLQENDWADARHEAHRSTPVSPRKDAAAAVPA